MSPIHRRPEGARCSTRVRTRRHRAAGVLAFAFVGFVGLGMGGAWGQDGGNRVLATTVDHPITPVIADHLSDGVSKAAEGGYQAYLIRLDTPGGLDSSMRSIVQDVLASEVPVIVYVSPQGARGASAGAIITFAAHVAAMAPGTAIGAATPVDGASGDDLNAKIVNDAIAYAEALADLRDRNEEFISETVREGRSGSASEALEEGAIDLVAASEGELLEAIDGMEVELADGATTVLSTAGATVDEHDLGVLRTIQQLLADPNIAFLLLSIGTLGLIYELASPGIGVGGALGLTFVLLAMFGLAVLPVDIVGILFLLLAVACFIAEVYAPGLGLAAAGGALSLVLSGIFLVDDAPGLELSLAIVLPTAVVVAAFVVVAGRIAMRSRHAPSTMSGEGLLIGWQGPVRQSPAGPQVFARGAWWRVRPQDPAHPINGQSPVEVVAVDGLDLIVSPISPSDDGPTQEGPP